MIVWLVRPGPETVSTNWKEAPGVTNSHLGFVDMSSPVHWLVMPFAVFVVVVVPRGATLPFFGAMFVPLTVYS